MPRLSPSPQTTERRHHLEEVLLVCPVRGPLGATGLARDGLTPTEEARRVDFLHFLLDDRNYPPDHIRVEVVTIKNLGARGRNKLRADVIVYDRPWANIAGSDKLHQLEHAILVAEIKRESSQRRRGISQQLEPALLLLPRLDALGAYWDDENRILFTKSLSTRTDHPQITVHQDSIANLPDYGIAYQTKAITVDSLAKPTNLLATLHSLANIMRSHGVNDEHKRYRETVKLLLARYVDERKARGSTNKQLRLQVLPGGDPNFLTRLDRLYTEASIRYQRVQTLFTPAPRPQLDEPTLRELVGAIHGLDFSSASSEVMQQVFMKFVPIVFKKRLSQYFTPPSLIDTTVNMAAPGPTEKIVDPAMGTADFLTAALHFCHARGDDDAVTRIYGIDSDESAYDLAIINMILNKDGQANLLCEDSIENHQRWLQEMDVALCNPPFGARTVERRADVLAAYDLGHVWQSSHTHSWTITSTVASSQQLGILFIERCWKMLRPGGRLAIILPEGYLATKAHGYVRQWILDHFVVRSLVELPRRIFVKSDADLRSNILLGEKKATEEPAQRYPIHASMVRRVGYKLGGNFGSLPLRDPVTGFPIRDAANRVVLNSDFRRVLEEYRSTPARLRRSWIGATVAHIQSHPDLDMKPRRLVPRALENVRALRAKDAIALGDVAQVVEEKVDLLEDIGRSEFRRVVEGQDIRAVEGVVIPHPPERCWAIAQRKSRNAYQLKDRDLVVGLVRPERRNVGILLDQGGDVVGSPDGLAVVRIRMGMEEEYPTAWLFAMLRSEHVRLQFWTQSGGTSYGKLDLDQIRNVLIPPSTRKRRQTIAMDVDAWVESAKQYSKAWSRVGRDEDRQPILNSPLTGLFDEDHSEGAWE